MTVTILSHAHNCACVHTYSSSHTGIHITYYTPHHTHYTLFIPYTYTDNTATPMGQCIAHRTHKPLPKKLLLTRTPSVFSQSWKLLDRLTTRRSMTLIGAGLIQNFSFGQHNLMIGSHTNRLIHFDTII